jgi:hypothetical protein
MIDVQWLKQEHTPKPCGACRFPDFTTEAEQRMFARISTLAVPPAFEFTVSEQAPPSTVLCEDCVERLTALIEATRPPQD